MVANSFVNNASGGGGGGAGLAQTLGALFNNPKKPYDAAEDQFDKYGQRAQDAQAPYAQAGAGALPKYNNYLDSMSNPTDFINKIMSQYKQSPYNKFLQDQGQRAITNSASASGLIGSTPYQQAGADYAENIAGQGMQDWLKNVLGANTEYGTGEKSLVDTGQNSANQLTQILSDLGINLGKMEYGKESADQNNNGDLMSGILQMILHGIGG